MQARLAAAGARTVTLMYGNVFFAEPNCAYFARVAASPWLWLNASDGMPYRPGGRFTFEARSAAARAWWPAGVLLAANVSGGFGDACGDKPGFLTPAEQAAFAAGQLAMHAAATAAVRAATGGLYVANCPIVPQIGDKPVDGVDGEMIESWCSDFAPGAAGPAAFCRDELAEAVVLAAAPNRTWLQARYYLNKNNGHDPQFGLAAFLVAASEGSFFGASVDWNWAGDWADLLAWPWASRPLGAPTGPPTLSDPTACAWSRSFANATASVNVCTKHLFARIEWGTAGRKEGMEGDEGAAEPAAEAAAAAAAAAVAAAAVEVEATGSFPPLRNIEITEAGPGGYCAAGAARVAAPWAQHGWACLAWREGRRGQPRTAAGAGASSARARLGRSA